MPKDSDRPAGALKTETGAGKLSGLFAEESEFDRPALWRIGTWGAAAIVAVILAVVVNQSQLGWRREQIAAEDLAQQAQQIQSLARESQNQTRRLASAIDTLDNDRDRLFSRVTVLEQGLDSVTGAIARQNSPVTAAATPPSPQAAPAPPSPPPVAVRPTPQNQAAAPAIATVTTAPASAPEKPRAETAKLESAKPELAKSEPVKPEPVLAAAAPMPAAPAVVNPHPPVAAPPAPLAASKSTMTPPEPVPSKAIEPIKAAAIAATPAPGPDTTASLPTKAPSAEEPDVSQASASEVAVQQTEFAVDLGAASSIGGLRALWRGLLRSNAELAALRPIIVVKERNTGLGMQLRLAAGPLKDAAAAAKICATLAEGERTCETTLFDGQRLAMKADDAEPLPIVKAQKPSSYRHGTARQVKKEDPPPPPKPEPSAFSLLFGRH